MGSLVGLPRLRLDAIKLAGFKSFVEPTTIDLPSNLVGIVGPNGCGKSNIIDAVRWVMGESSAKNLRGESMADVIFNGSTDRKPLGQASIELTFNNPDGALGGEYAHFEKIIIRREVTRDGQSNYYLNNTRCRRRDITDIFLGTGLGPRSYAIIGQGTISRIIEAKPEELRVYLEEAAGISKYKERRRETENRMRHTRENLDRLTDIREELQQQLDRLQRQAQAAERYQILKADERRLEQELLALRWRYQAEQSKALASQIQQAELALEAKLAELTRCEATIETLRDEQYTHTDGVQALQENVYLSGQKVSQLEQAIASQQIRQQQCEQDIASNQASLVACQTDGKSSQAIITERSAELQQLTPQLSTAETEQEQLQQTLDETELALNNWQQQWDTFTSESHQAQRQAQVQQTQIQHLEQQIQSLRSKSLRSRELLDRIEPGPLQNEIAAHEAAQANLQANTTELTAAKQTAQQHLHDTRQQLDLQRQTLQQQQQALQQVTGRLASLEALQQAALGREQGDSQDWLIANQLDKAPRLGEQLQVAPEWALAVETVLGQYLQAVCVENLTHLASSIESSDNVDVILWQPATNSNESTGDGGRLSEVVTGDDAAVAFLDSIFYATDLPAALAKSQTLAAHESVITQEGIWLGRSWLRVPCQDQTSSGVFAREAAIKEAKEMVASLNAQTDELKAAIEVLEEQLLAVEQQRESLQQQWQQANHELADVTAQRQVKQSRLQQMQQRQQQLDAELAEYADEIDDLQSTLLETRAEWQTAMEAMQQFADEREQLQTRKVDAQTAYEQAKQATKAINQQVQEFRLQHQRLTSDLEAKRDLLARSTKLQAQYESKLEELSLLQESLISPVADWQEGLAVALDERLVAENALQSAKQQLQNIDYQLREIETQRSANDKAAQQQREAHNKLLLDKQAFDVRQTSIQEQLDEYDVDIDVLMSTLPEAANEGEWQAQLERVKQRISRLGAINLAAIDEFATQSERKNYLDAQHDDLTQALDVLAEAIAKIDKETRQRFKATYDTVNEGFKTLFPKVFGGGSAVLELTGEDLLDTGVAVMARPPGKKNATIHLLSGGEKALTAIALVFAIFQLNPAPFCMLDEVDAPLDDQNVGRYCQLVKEMSEDVQFIFISHNKIAMEMSEQLIGVTMREPGVSRMVSVDIQKAIDMVDM